MGRTLKDAVLKKTIALPTGASSVTSAGIDLEHGAKGDVVADFEVKVSAPALAVGELANTSTMKYDLISSDSSDMSGPTTLVKECIVQTGAASAGAIAAEFVGRLSIDCQRYVAVKATNSAAANASAKSATIELLF
jgi:hypothetical protein